MALRPLQKAQQIQHGLLWRMWVPLGTMLGIGLPPWRWEILLLNPSQRLEPLATTMDRPGTTEAKEPKKETKKSKIYHKRWWERKWEDQIQTAAWNQSQVARAGIGLLQDPKRQTHRTAPTEDYAATKSGRILGGGTGPHCDFAVDIPGRYASGDTGQGRQAQEDFADGPTPAYWSADKGEEGIGLTERSKRPPHGCMEATCGEVGAEHPGPIATIPECHPGLQDMRGGNGATVPECTHSHLTDHAAEQTCRGGSSGPQRHGQRHPGWHCHSTHQRGRSGPSYRSGWRDGNASRANPKYAHSVCCVARHQDKGKIKDPRRRGWAGHQSGQKRREDRFLRRRSGQKSAQQSVLTELDRLRNLRFLQCVEICECGYEGPADHLSYDPDTIFKWTILGEPKLPSSNSPRLGMTSEAAIAYNTFHPIRSQHDYLDPWNARAAAFQLQLEVSMEDTQHMQDVIPHYQAKPNHGIMQDFDSVLPYRSRMRDGQVLRGQTPAPLHWEENLFLRTAGSAGATFRDARGDLRVSVRTWIAARNPTLVLPHRDVTVRAQLMNQLESRIRRIWSDQINAEDRVRLSVVRPTPRVERNAQRVLHILLEINRGNDFTRQPILIAHREIDHQGPSDVIHWIPILLESPVGLRALHQTCAAPCREDQLLVPHAGRERRWLRGDQRRQLFAGLFLPIWWDLRLGPYTGIVQEDDTTAMFQTSIEYYQPLDARFRTIDTNEDEEVSLEYTPDNAEQPELYMEDFRIHAESYEETQSLLSTACEVAGEEWTVVSHGLVQTHFDTRRINLEQPTEERLRMELREAWADLPYPARLIFVRPNPGALREIHVIVEFYTSVPPPIHGHPLLSRVLGDHDEPTQVEAAYFYQEENHLELIRQARLHERCEPWGREQCAIRLGGVPLRAGIPWRLAAGQLIDFHVQGEPVSDDLSSFMQANQVPEEEISPTPTERYYVAHTYHMSTSYKLAQVEQTPGLTLTDQLTRLWKPPRSEAIVAIHEVSEPPHDLLVSADSTLIVEMSQDQLRRAQEDDRQILVDIQIADRRARDVGLKLRKVVWARKSMTRPQVLQLLSAQSMCHDVDMACTLWLNKIYWPDTDQASRHLNNGDYAHLLIRSIQLSTVKEIYQGLCAQEEADTSRYLFRRSPTPTQSSQDTENDENAGEDRRSRSRTRSLSLLQTSSHLIRKPLGDMTNISQTDDHRPTSTTTSDKDDAWPHPCDSGKPHVSDRWCVEPSNTALAQRPDLIHQPEPHDGRKAVLCLDELVQRAVRLCHLPGNKLLPTIVEIKGPVNPESVQCELGSWGHQAQVWALTVKEGPQTYLCGKEPDEFTYVYWDQEQEKLYTHVRAQGKSHTDHLSFLAKIGYGRATLIQQGHYDRGVQVVEFHNGVPKEAPTGPLRQPWNNIPCVKKRQGEYSKLSANMAIQDNWKTAHHVKSKGPIVDIRDIFGTGKKVLMTDTTELELHPATKEALDGMPHGSTDKPYDRLLIYVDGSSHGNLKHKDPRHIEETSTPDAWGFAVLGEYADGRTNSKEFLGWTANRVIYDSDTDYYVGATRISSDSAEREGLIWSGLWRLSLDLDTPTFFVTDSQIAGRFAKGDSGTSAMTSSHYNVRGVHQALQQALGDKDYGIFHVRSHAGDPWNELADVAAKQASNVFRYRPRQMLRMREWQPLLPYLWFYFGQEDQGLPPRTPCGIWAMPPHIPPKGQRQEATPYVQSSIDTIRISCATVNVRTMLQPGKLQYLQEQFGKDNFNLVALQETRTSAGFTGKTSDYIRIATGACNSQCGMELWVSRTQPFGTRDGKEYYANANQIVVQHGDSRRLLATIHFGSFTLGVFNLHGPHTGRPEEERERWWQETTRILQKAHHVIDEIIVMGDFNARSGPRDGIVVFDADDYPSANTPYAMDFLKEFSLCLPATGSQHHGTTTTWTAPNGATTHRIDHIAISATRLNACTHSEVLQHIDLGHEGDHCAVGLDMVMARFGRKHKAQKNAGGQAFDRTKIKGNCGVQDDLRAAKPSPWTMNIEAQVNALNEVIAGTLKQHCEKDHPSAKKPFITDEIMKLRQAKNILQRQQSTARTMYRRILLQRVVYAWRDGENSLNGCPDAFDVQLSLGLLRIGCRIAHTTRTIHGQVRRAKRNYVEKIIDEIPKDASSSTILTAMRPVIGTSNTRKRKGGAIPYVMTKDGEACQTPEELVNRWVEHFGEMEGADRLTNDAQRELWIAGLQKLQAEDFGQLNLEELPTLTDLETAMRRVQPGKAVGDDQVPPEACRYHAQHLAKLVYPSLLKLFLHGQEDLAHKGGRLVMAYKRGPRQECMSYRSLLISSHIGKCMHRALRCGQNSLYTSFMQRQQVGGRPKISVGIGVHMARAHHRTAKLAGCPSALLFLDLKEAYYRVLRPLALGSEYVDSDVAAMVQRLRLPRDVLDDLAVHLREADSLTLAAVPTGHRRYLQALHRDTHFRIDGQPDRSRTTIGSRPGDTFADVVFGYLWSRVLKQIESALDEANALDRIPIFDGPSIRAQRTEAVQPFLGPTWCDDLCVCITAATCAELEQKAGLVGGTLLDTCQSFGMQPNTGTGKTELLLCLRGPGSKNFRIKYHGPAQARKMMICGEYGAHYITVVGEYKHLGGLLHHSGKLTREVGRRLAIANTTFTQHRALLLQNPKFELSRRVELFRSLVLSGFLYGTESWVPSSRKEDLHIHGAVLRLYKRLLKRHPASHDTDREICATLGIATPTIQLRVSRLRYLGQIYNSLPQDLWNVILQDQEWLQVIDGDLTWMWQQLRECSNLPNPHEGSEAWQQWEYILRFHGGFWKRLVRRAMDHAILQQQNAEVVHTAHLRILESLRLCGRFQRDTPRSTYSAEMTFGCLTCGVRCKTKAGEGAHMFKVHGHQARVRRLFEGTHCPQCMREYHTPYKLQMHLRYKQTCRNELIAEGMDFDPQPGKGSQHHNDYERRHDGLLPVQVTHGPTAPVVGQRAWNQADEGLQEALGEAIMDWHDTRTGCEQDLERRLRDVVQRRATSWTMWTATMEALLRDLLEMLTQGHHEVEGVVFDVCRKLMKDEEWVEERKEPKSVDNELDGHFQCEDLLDDYDDPGWNRTVSPERGFSQHRVVFHAFSGRRRPGDFQHYLDALTPQLPGVTVHVLSVDIVINQGHGNLMCPRVRRFWLESTARGWVVGLLAGPPCETWSKARNQQLADAPRGGPRPVRTQQQPWALPSLSLREIRQVLFGNVLLTFALEMLALLGLQGGFGVIEHPAEPEDLSLPSIFRLPLVRLLLGIPGFMRLRIYQGLYGSESPKPTDLLTLNMGDLEKVLRDNCTKDKLPYTRSIGKDTEGRFLTSRLKEYPPAMCKALAEGFFTCLADCHVKCKEAISEQFLSTCELMEVTTWGNHYGPDYAG